MGDRLSDAKKLRDEAELDYKFAKNDPYATKEERDQLKKKFDEADASYKQTMSEMTGGRVTNPQAQGNQQQAQQQGQQPGFTGTKEEMKAKVAANNPQDTPQQSSGDQPSGNQPSGDQSAGDQPSGESNGLVSHQPTDDGSEKKKKENFFKKAWDKTWKGGKNVGGALSDAFYNGLAGATAGKSGGNQYDVQAATTKALAQDYKNDAQNRQMEAQRAAQISNRNEFDEASKIASVQNNAENKQNINNLSAAAGNSAALARKTNTADVQTQAARQDTQAQVGNERRDQADAAQQQATAMQGASKSFDIESRDFVRDKAKEDMLTMGVGGTEDEQQGAEEEASPQDETPEEPQQEPEASQEEQQQETKPSGNPQHVINWLLGSSKGQDIAPQSGAEGDNGLAAWVQEKFGVQPAKLGQYDGPDDKAGETFEKKWLADPNAPGDKQGAIQALRQGRAGEGNDASRNFSSKDYDQMNQSMNVPSDVHIKSLERELSDFRMKCIKEDWDRYGVPSEDDFEWLLSKAGKLHRDDRDYGWDDEDDSWYDEPPVVDAYARHIKNYVYNYKPEATDIDPSIDPDEEHIGPMAQDIEQVNPACIKETPEGVKTVDTARLALMNAGAIGDLARQLKELSDKFEALVGGR